jgi:hypothetical protein
MPLERSLPYRLSIILPHRLTLNPLPRRLSINYVATLKALGGTVGGKCDDGVSTNTDRCGDMGVYGARFPTENPARGCR